MKSIIIKLLSNKSGKVIINDNECSFEKNEIKKIDINYDELKIKAIDNDFIFAIKLNIDNDIINLENQEYEFYFIKEKFVRAKIKIFEYYFMYFTIENPSCAYYSYELNDEKTKYAITKGDILYKYNFPYFDLGLYTKKENIYLFLYVYNNEQCSHIYLNIHFIPKFQPQKNNFSQTENGYNIYFYNKSEKNAFFFIPCSLMSINYRFTDKFRIVTTKN